MVQAPQSPSAHPSFVPVRRARVRSQSSTVMLGGALSALQGLPFNRNCTAVMAGADCLMSAPREAATADTPCKLRTSSHRGCKAMARVAAHGFAHFFGSNGCAALGMIGARPATSRRVLATRPISLPERSALIAAPRTGTNGAFRHLALTRGAGDASIQHGALGREQQPTRTWRGETMRPATLRLRAIVAGVACLAIPLAAARCNRRSRKLPEKSRCASPGSSRASMRRSSSPWTRATTRPKGSTSISPKAPARRPC